MMMLLIIDIYYWIDRIGMIDRIDFGDDDVRLLLLSRQPILRMAKINLRLYPHSLSVVIAINIIAIHIVIFIDNNIVIVKMRIKERR